MLVARINFICGVQPSASRIAANMLFPVATATGALAFIRMTIS
jgi:hypothetical protein